MDRGHYHFIPETCLCKSKHSLNILDKVIALAVEIAREGREGKKIGTIFTVFDAGNVLKNSRCMILDPLFLHDNAKKNISDPDLRETVKELAQLDGAFIVDNQGVVLSACRYLIVTADNIDLPLGLGSRHFAAASISKKTNCISVAVSESSVVRIFVDGKMVSEILPEIWLLNNYRSHIEGKYSKRRINEMTVLDKETA